MKRPNFFFIGAPKCGTTSIAHVLSKHPNIFISNPKEPNFFAKDLSNAIQSLQVYESLFRNAKDHHKVIGEASTTYLFSKTAIQDILFYSPTAKFLVSIRNPYEMAISLHGHAVRGGYENENNFSMAWKLQNKRRQGLRIPKSCFNKRLLIYEDRCALGDQIERLYDRVPANKICLVFFDDLKSRPLYLYEKIFQFLNVSNNFHGVEFPKLNKKITVRWPIIPKLTGCLGKIKRSLGIYESIGLANRIVEITSKSEVKKPIITKDVWEKMDEAFIPQIKKIESISRENLSRWYYYRI